MPVTGTKYSVIRVQSSTAGYQALGSEEYESEYLDKEISEKWDLKKKLN